MQDSTSTTRGGTSLSEIFSGRRGRLLGALLLAEFGTAVHGIAYASVLPVAAHDLSGADLYGATLVGGNIATLIVIATGSFWSARLRPSAILLLATALFVVGVTLTAGALSMWMMLAGMVVRGAAGGFLAGIELTAVAALYSGPSRVRVIGLFASVWLLPSLAGAPINGVISATWGWRTAMAWPALIIVIARIAIGRHADLVPWTRRSSARLRPYPTLVLLAGLVGAASAPSLRSVGSVGLVYSGVAVATCAGLYILHQQSDGALRLFFCLVAVFGLTFAFFGGDQIIALAAIDGLGGVPVTGTAVVGAGAIAWSLASLRSSESRTVGVLGSVLLLTALVGAASVVGGGAKSGLAGIIALVVSWGLAGLGMGLAYPQFSSRAMDVVPTDRANDVAISVAFAELAGMAVGTLSSGGTYSVGHVVGWTVHASLATGFGIMSFGALTAAAINFRTSAQKSL